MNRNDKKKQLKSKKPLPNSFVEHKVKESIQLIDFLFLKYPKLSRNNIKSLLTSHRVSVDGAPISQYNFMLSKEDTVIVSKNPIRRKQRKNLPIIYEDDEFIVINKPSGLLSVASDKEKSSTAYRMVTDYLQAKSKSNRIFVVHRLDEDTSGVLIFVKNEKLKETLQKDWSSLVTKRGYFAIIEGSFKNKEDEFIDYLKENSLNLMYVSDDKIHGKKCITQYKTIKTNKLYSLLDVNILTGRKNQIRVQFAHRKHPVIGDDKYLEPSNPLNRLGLHAYEVSLKHPFNNKLLTFKAEMPKEFDELLKK